jgi:hypothetical protein
MNWRLSRIFSISRYLPIEKLEIETRDDVEFTQRSAKLSTLLEMLINK